MQYTEECKYLADYMMDRWPKILDRYHLSPEDVDLKILSKTEYMSIYPKIILKNDVYELEDVVKYPDISKFNSIAKESRRQVWHTGNTVAFSLSLIRKNSDDTYSSANYTVYCIMDDLEKLLKNDNIDTVKLKLPAIDMVLRHEIGHILVMDEFINHCTKEEVTNFINSISEVENQQIREWGIDGNSLDPYHYHQKHGEAMANGAADITFQEIVTASAILSVSFKTGREEGIEWENKSRKPKKKKKKNKNKGNNNVNN